MKKGTVFVLAVAVVVLSCAGISSATVLGTIEYDGGDEHPKESQLSGV